MKGYHYAKVSSSQWAWGPTAHWRLYFSLKTFGKRCASFLSTDSENNSSNCNQDRRRRPNCRHQYRSRHTSNFDKSQYKFPNVSEITITDGEVNDIIRENEITIDEFPESQIVEKCEINQLKSNEPNEDQVFLTKSVLKEGLLFGVLDGHGGSVFGEQMKARLPYYFHTSLIEKSKLLSLNLNDVESLVEVITNDEYVVENSINSDIWVEKVSEYLQELLEKDKQDSPKGSLSPMSSSILKMFGKGDEETQGPANYASAIKDAFVRLDEDVINELIELAKANKMCQESLQLATSGCCALVAYIEEDDLHIANLGDCRAVLGSNKNGIWNAIQLTYDHTAG